MLKAIAGTVTTVTLVAATVVAAIANHDDSAHPTLQVSSHPTDTDGCEVTADDAAIPVAGLSPGVYRVLIDDRLGVAEVSIHRSDGALIFEADTQQPGINSDSVGAQQFAKLAPGRYHLTCDFTRGVESTTDFLAAAQ